MQLDPVFLPDDWTLRAEGSGPPLRSTPPAAVQLELPFATTGTGSPGRSRGA
jgi:hypothetical protein